MEPSKASAGNRTSYPGHPCRSDVTVGTEVIRLPTGGKKLKPPHYRPGQAVRVPRGRGSQISRQPTHEGGKVVSPTYRPLLPQEIILVLISC
jgi:hypothetical protein